MRISFLTALMAASAFVPAAASGQEVDAGVNAGISRLGELREERAAAREQAAAEAAVSAPAPQPAQPQFESQLQSERQAQLQAQLQAPQQAQASTEPQLHRQPDPEREAFRQDRREDRQEFGRQSVADDRNTPTDPVTRPEDHAGQRHDPQVTHADHHDHRADSRDIYRGGWRGTDERGDAQRYWNRNRYDSRYQGYDDNRAYRPSYDTSRAWDRDWRGDERYDWNRYRGINRGVFNLPRYYAPYGWNYGYRRFSIGLTLSSILFDQDYWIEDSSYYRLPPAYGPYRWVRYYNDALLVDIRSGHVVDTVYNIFW